MESIIHFLIELYRNWGEDSETEWRGLKKKIGGTKSKSNCPIFLKRSLLHICAPPLPALEELWFTFESSWLHQPCKETAILYWCTSWWSSAETEESENECRHLNRTREDINLVVLKSNWSCFSERLLYIPWSTFENCSPTRWWLYTRSVIVAVCG